MTPQDHNKALVTVYTILATLFTLILIALPLIILNKIKHEPSTSTGEVQFLAWIFGFVLLFTLLLISTAYGLWKRKAWVRKPALILSILAVWYFPLGTALSVYTWWFLHSEGGRQLYFKA